LETSQNRKFSIRALGTDIGCKDRISYEMNMLNPCFELLQAVFAASNEDSGRIQFKKVESNPAKYTISPTKIDFEIDTEIDLIFNCPGIPLYGGSQRLFTKIINTLILIPHCKSTFVNLEQIRCAVQEFSNIILTDEMIWKSIRSSTFQRLTREFYWKCIHNIFRVGHFWTHIQHSEVFGSCHICDVPETLEHIREFAQSHMSHCMAPDSGWRGQLGPGFCLVP
jgi:hypothetical protein